MTTATLKEVPDIIKAASTSVLGILALLIIVLAFFGAIYFRKSGAGFQFAAFALVFCGTAAFGTAVFVTQREDALRANQQEIERIQRETAQTVRDLLLSLKFVGDAPYPYNAHVNAYVQKKNESQEQPRNDIITPFVGIGGIKVNFSKLTVGDKVRVEVEEGGKQWRSDDMQMLEANLNMNPKVP